MPILADYQWLLAGWLADWLTAWLLPSAWQPLPGWRSACLCLLAGWLAAGWLAGWLAGALEAIAPPLLAVPLCLSSGCRCGL